MLATAELPAIQTLGDVDRINDGEVIALSAVESRMLLKFHRTYVLFFLTAIALSSAKAADGRRADEQALDAEEHGYLEALDAAIKAPGDQQTAIYSNYINLAGVNEERHRFAEAEKYYELAYNTDKPLFGAQSREVAKTL